MSAEQGTEGCVRVFAEYDRDFREEVDVAVIGSGPTGAVIAYELARGGERVLLLEEGPPFTPRDFELEGSASMAKTMREAGLRSTRGFVMPTMQAICLGGGSLVNSAICVRPPPFVLDQWATRFDLDGISRRELDPHYDAVEEFLGIAPTPENVQGARNLLFRDGCESRGYSHEPMPRNVRGCRGSGECFTGCRSRAKQSMDISYVPAAIRHGARVLTSVRVERLVAEGKRVQEVVGRVVAPISGAPSFRFRVRAKTVVLAAGCLASPVILLKSGNLANRSGQVGENLQFHPGVAVMGVFPGPIDPQFGATQGYQSLQFLEEGFKLESLWGPPAVLAVRLPGFGRAFKERLSQVPRAAVWDAIGSCHRSLGRVGTRRGTLNPALRYRLDPEDAKILQRSLYVLIEIFFAAGAEKVVPGVLGFREELDCLDQADILRRESLRPNQLLCASTHVFCTTRMHGDPQRGVVDAFGKCHDLENLYLADTGIFPQCPSVNPMLTGMALARRSAHHLLARS